MIKGIENKSNTWPGITIIFGVLAFLISAVLYLTHTDYYQSCVVLTSVIVAIILCLLSLGFLIFVPPYLDGLTLVGHFALCSEILLLIYTVIPMPLYACVGIGTIYSIIFEILTAYLYGFDVMKKNFIKNTTDIRESSLNFNSISNDDSIKNLHSSLDVRYNYYDDDVDFSTTLAIRILMQICIHIIGVHILIMTFVRMRGTFMKVGNYFLKLFFLQSIFKGM